MKFEICMAAKIENGCKDHICIVPTDPLKAIQKVIFNDLATIVYWIDGTKTVVKCQNEKFDSEKGLAMAISKKFFGNRGNYYNVFRKHLENPDSGDIIKNSTKPINGLHHDEINLQTNHQYLEKILGIVSPSIRMRILRQKWIKGTPVSVK